MPRDLFHDQLAEVSRELRAMGQLVQAAIADAIAALIGLNVDEARLVIQGDALVNERYARIEKRCVEMLALQQPAAGDLRQIAATLKVITDLERMGDHAVDIARVVVRLEGKPHVKPLVDIPVMADMVREMVTDALDAFVEKDMGRALSMVEKDHEVDRLHRDVILDLQSLMQRNPDAVPQGIQFLFVSGALERIADHATNLAEWLVYRETGRRAELNP